MTTISLSDWSQSPEILVGEQEHKRLTITAMTDVGGAERIDFLLYELDRARIMRDALLPADVIRIGSIVRYKSLPGEERTIKLVLPADEHLPGGYRLSVTSAHGAALLGLRPGHIMTWIDPDSGTQRIKVLKVANTGPRPIEEPGSDDPGPSAA
ncbi:GreA/GreB family elongation factor [Devosia sp. YIM 151766]|uniref:GreA/GreB family elongation factor n=1 Tax=Devosia sp. YIM 151766 TaxID=3017325 RepID=UPI00255C9CBE|nr:GreA/GreB family elongation factor [Devosia sp. YIM 151766]WIY52673.1 GreA/GreB family elongation factor [Devosia sp. YIM 151766]